MFRSARFIIATDTLCAVAEKTPEDATAAFARLIYHGDVKAEEFDPRPRLALVDDPTSPKRWCYTEEYYRLRHANLRHSDAGAYDVGEVHFFEQLDAAVEAANALNALGEEWDVQVVAFDEVDGSGRVVMD